MERLVGLLYRCTYVGGSSTLITRCGLLSWIDSRVHASNTSASDIAALRHLASRVYDTSEKSRVDEWSGGAVKLATP
jgi:nucleolar pre-ribosomal-associated protein 1